MKKRIMGIVLVLALALSVCVSAAPRYDDGTYVYPMLDFEGTTAVCALAVDAARGASIKATLTLSYSNGKKLKAWSNLTDTTYMGFEGTCSVSSGETYTLTATVVVDGQTITKSTTATCP